MGVVSKFFVGYSALILIFVSVPIMVAAQDDAVNPTQEQSSTVNPMATTDEEKAQREAQRKARIDEAKTKVAAKLSDAEERRIAGVCKAAQTVVARQQENLNKVLENRSTKYSTVSEKLNTLLTRLQQTSADTSQLEAAIILIDSQIAVIVAEATAYQAALSDLADMECQGDPSGFKAIIEQARAARASLLGKAKALKTYITQDVRAILNAIKDQVNTADSSTN